MARRKKHNSTKVVVAAPTRPEGSAKGLRELYRHARQLAIRGEGAEARRLYGVVGQTVTDPPFKARLHNDLAILDALGVDYEAAFRNLEQALLLDPNCTTARDNLALLQQDVPRTQQPAAPVAVDTRPRVARRAARTGEREEGSVSVNANNPFLPLHRTEQTPMRQARRGLRAFVPLLALRA
jgi:hypothetical protein